MRNNYLLWLLVVILFSGSCKKFDKPEKVASYVYIPNIKLHVEPTEGTASNGITDAWVYVNEQPVGVFGLPCRVPILSEGNQEIKVYAGIMDDGIQEQRNKYTFFQPYVTSAINLTPGKVDTLNGANEAVVSYYPSSQIDIWYENFDNASINFVANTNSDAGVTYVNDPAYIYEGTGSGKIELTSGMSFARIHTSQLFTLPKGAKPVYVELNYNTNNTMAVGIEALVGTGTTDIDNTVIKPSGGVWKKMYVNLTEIVTEQGSSTQFRFIISINKDDGVTTVENYFDNFKVVYAK